MNTPWTEFLAQEGARLEASEVRFDAPEVEARLAATATVVVPLTHLASIRSTGEDSANLLHNLFSNDIKKLAPDAAQWNSFNTPKGRMLASLLVWREGDGHVLVTAADIQPMLVKKLSMYILRSKVRLADATPDIVLLGVTGSDAAGVLARAGLSAPAADMHHAPKGDVRCVRLRDDTFLIAVPATAATDTFAKLKRAGAAPAGTAAWQLAMIRAGVPHITAPTQEEFVAQMLNFDLIGGVSFNKGCYPGQEIVARTQYLGKVKKRMFRVRAADGTPPAPGTDLFAADFGTQSAGKIVNAAPAADGGFEALAVMQMSSAEAGDVRVGTPDGTVLSILDLPYALT